MVILKMFTSSKGNIKKYSLCLLSLLLFILISIGETNCYAHGYDTHNRELSYILFGTEYYPNETKAAKTFDLLCKAVYLAVDYTTQDNGYIYIEDLKKYGVKGLPSIESIQFAGNQYHQRYTHLGWNNTYVNDKANWEERKRLLTLTVEKMGNFRKEERIKIDAFSALCYEIHVLGDHIGDTESTKYTRLRLTSEPDYKGQEVNPDSDGPFNNPTLYTYLLYHIQRLFREQKSSSEYIELIRYLNKNKDYFRYNDLKSYDEIRQLAIETKETLHKYIPELLKRETFFERMFFEDNSFFEKVFH